MGKLWTFAPYGYAVLLTGLTAAVAVILRPHFGPHIPLMLFFIPIVLTGYLGHVRAALVAAVLSTLVGGYFSIEPIGSFDIDEAWERSALALFLLIAAGIAYFTARLSHSNRELAASESRIRKTAAELERAHAQQQILLRELKHRIRNMLTTIDSIALQTAHVSRSVPEFQQSFMHRLRALVRLNDILTSANWTNVSIRDLIESELAPRASLDSQVSLSGPPVLLGPRTAMALHMTIHELCTNSAKYGSLSVPSGKVSVCWAIEPQADHPVFRLTWEETGGPPVELPKRVGFGSELLEHTISYDLGGKVNLSLPRSGALCELSFPWSETSVASEPSQTETAPEALAGYPITS